MLKYFIENKKGEWLVPPGEHLGSCWTRDPYKAWTFDYRCSNNWEKHKLSAMYFMKELSKEIRFDPGIHVTEQEFISIGEVFNADSPGSTYHLSRTTKQSFMDQLMTGESWIQVTPEK